MYEFQSPVEELRAAFASDEPPDSSRLRRLAIIITLQMADRRSKFDPMTMLAGQAQATFSCQRVLIESAAGGSTQKLTKGSVRSVVQHQATGPGMQPIQLQGAEVSVTFEGWEKV